MVAEIVGIPFMSEQTYQHTGIFLNQKEVSDLMSLWYAEKIISYMTEKAWQKNDVSVSDYAQSLIYQKFFSLLWSLAINNGFTDRSKSIALFPSTREILYEERRLSGDCPN